MVPRNNQRGKARSEKYCVPCAQAFEKHNKFGAFRIDAELHMLPRGHGMEVGSDQVEVPSLKFASVFESLMPNRAVTPISAP